LKKLLFLLILFYSFSALAQETVSNSKIKLVDGSELQVLIIENLPGKYIKIKLPGDEDVIINYRDIVSIKHKSFVYHAKFLLPKGFFVDGSFSFLFGRSSEFSDLRFGLAIGLTANYRFNSYFAAGLGVEPTALFVNGGNMLLPVYAHFSGSFIERRIAPVYMLDAGWSLAANDPSSNATVDGGWFFRPTIGLQINKFTLGIGYQLQKITTTTDNAWWWGDNGLTVEERLMKNIIFSAHLYF
jgi:hypothetical protein